MPDFIITVTVALAVGFTWADEYGANSTTAKDKLTSARQVITNLQTSLVSHGHV